MLLPFYNHDWLYSDHTSLFHVLLMVAKAGKRCIHSSTEHISENVGLFHQLNCSLI